VVLRALPAMEGRAENRRVVVWILQNKGIAGN
jgi:hypothetical protein